MKQPAVYIMASGRDGTLYIGVTSDPVRHVYQHREGATAGFTARCGCTRPAAIARERQLKAGSRTRKIALIEAANPEWRDPYPEIV
jgi:putative endonuclease